MDDSGGRKPKDVQGQMRHARIATAMDIYAQHVPESQRRAVARTMQMVEVRRAQLEQSQSTTIN
jgi:mono/diheme cytochrome c family protein